MNKQSFEEKYNITEKTTEEDLRKILIKEILDKEIRKKERKEYNLLKHVMKSKHK